MGREYCIAISDRKDNPIEGGLLVRDYTAASRCRFRLLCRRGEWLYDPECGALLHTIKDLREGQRKAAGYVQQALQPLIDEGSIVSVVVDEVEEDPITGMLGVAVTITLPDGEAVSLGNFRLGN